MKDMTGYKISINDWVIFPRMVGESPVLAFGVVQKVGTKSITVRTSHKYQPDRWAVSAVLTRPKAVLQVEPEDVPDEIYHSEIYRD